MENIGEFESIVVSTISEPYNRENPDELRLLIILTKSHTTGK